MGVPAAIQQLRDADIKVIVLTGDRLETAIEIGFSCNLLDPSGELMIVSSDSQEGARSQIEAALQKVSAVRQEPTSFATVIDGDTLRWALEDPLKELFLQLLTSCDTAICCRVSPSQKAGVVALVKEGCSAMTLAIGDGQFLLVYL